MRHEHELAGSAGGAPTAAVRAQLMRMLQSRAFARSPRLRRFLTYAVDAALSGRFEQLREYTLGIDVFDRGDRFDPAVDPIVRVDARRLRKAIQRYYAEEGQGDPVEIALPTGSYMPVFRLRATGVSPRRRRGVRLAVARFSSSADDDVAQGFAEGLTDEVLLALTGRPEFQVVAGQRPVLDGEDLAAFADHLGADLVLSGKVHRERGSVRVRAALSAADGAQVWADRYDARLADLTEVLALQDQLARRIAELVAPRLRGWRLRARPTTGDAEAYELYLRGRHQLNASRPETLQGAIERLEAARARDPQFAEALAALSEAHMLRWLFQLAAPTHTLPEARRFAEAALALEPDLPAAHAALGRVRVAMGDRPAAEASLERALALDHLAPSIRYARASWLLAPTGRLEEARNELAALLQEAPYSLRLRYDYARVLYFQRRFDDAIRHLELILEFQPDFPGALFALAFAYEHAGQFDAARAAHERHVRAIPAQLVVKWLEAANAVWDGDLRRARDLVEAMDVQAQHSPMAATVLADAWLRLGDRERAIGWLERAAEQRLYRAVYLAVDPDYEPLRTEPRFRRLLSSLGLGEAPASAPGH